MLKLKWCLIILNQSFQRKANKHSQLSNKKIQQSKECNQKLNLWTKTWKEWSLILLKPSNQLSKIVLDLTIGLIWKLLLLLEIRLQEKLINLRNLISKIQEVLLIQNQLLQFKHLYQLQFKHLYKLQFKHQFHHLQFKHQFHHLQFKWRQLHQHQLLPQK